MFFRQWFAPCLKNSLFISVLIVDSDSSASLRVFLTWFDVLNLFFLTIILTNAVFGVVKLVSELFLFKNVTECLFGHTS